MFDELSARLTAALSKLTGRGVLTEEAVKDGLREIRRVLLEQLSKLAKPLRNSKELRYAHSDRPIAAG